MISIEYIRSHPDRWEFISGIILIYVTAPQKDISIRLISEKIGKPRMFVSRMLEIVKNDLFGTELGQEWDKSGTVDKLQVICESILCNNEKSNFGTELGQEWDKSGTMHKEERVPQNIYIKPHKEENFLECKNKENTAKAVKKRSAFQPPTDKECVEFFVSNGSTETGALNFFDYWESLDWTRKNGKVKDWKATARTWIRNEGRFSANQSTQQRYGTETKYERRQREDMQLAADLARRCEESLKRERSGEDGFMPPPL